MTSRTFEYLASPDLAGLYWPGIVTGLIIALGTAALSVLTVLKRMAFIGQGVSHAAFGGVGLAAALGLVGGAAATGTVLQFLVVFGFCFLAALTMGGLGGGSRSGGGDGSDRARSADSAIGIVLVASMAIGAILLRRASGSVSWESFLFGDILAVGWADAGVAGACAAAILGTLAWVRRPLLFHTFDPAAARAWGVNGRFLDSVLMLLLALATVTAMKLAGVVLATALLVLPGATALRLSRRAWTVLSLAHAAAVLGVLIGIVIAFEADIPTGPSIVCTLTALFGLAAGFSNLRDRFVVLPRAAAQGDLE